MEQTYTINLLDLGFKVRSKSELYKLLTSEANLYLPPYKEWSIEFITDYLEGRKSVSKSMSFSENNLIIRFSRRMTWLWSLFLISIGWELRIYIDFLKRSVMLEIICQLLNITDSQTDSGFQTLVSLRSSSSFS